MRKNREVWAAVARLDADPPQQNGGGGGNLFVLGRALHSESAAPTHRYIIENIAFTGGEKRHDSSPAQDAQENTAWQGL